jgi:hypothetical protein
MATKTPQQIFKEAAQAAAALLPEAEKERDKLQMKLAALDVLINRYRMLISTSQSTSSGVATISLSPSKVSATTSTAYTTSGSSSHVFGVALNDREPTAFEKVGLVLSKGGWFPAKEIAEKYRQEFSEAIPQSTLYNVLNKGREIESFIEKDGKWSLTEKSN